MESITPTLHLATVSARAAEHVRALLEPYCQQIEVVGDVRRRSYVTGRLHLLCVPLIVETVQGTLFSADSSSRPAARRNELHANLDRIRDTRAGGLMTHPEIISDGGKGRAAPWGERERWLQLSFEGETFRVFVYMCERERFGHMKLIRTGPEAFGREYVETLRQRHLVAAEGGIRDKRTGKLQPCYTEREAFGFVGWGYVKPWVRR